MADEQDLTAAIPYEEIKVPVNGFPGYKFQLLWLLRNLAQEYWKLHPEKPRTSFAEEIYKPLRTAAIAGDDMARYVGQLLLGARKSSVDKSVLAEERQVSMQAAAAYVAAFIAAERTGRQSESWLYLWEASHWEGYLSGLSSVSVEPGHEREADRAMRVARARNAARVRHSEGPKAAAKSFVKDCWQDWRAGLRKYDSTAAFARDMLDKQPALTSQQVIERWVRQWDEMPLGAPLPDSAPAE